MSIWIGFRNLFFRKIWECCKLLFSLGPLERRDAYCVLSLYLSFFYGVEGPENADSINRAEEFDVRDEREFWDEIKRGLVCLYNFSIFTTTKSVSLPVIIILD